jgi:hypothetical protein
MKERPRGGQVPGGITRESKAMSTSAAPNPPHAVQPLSDVTSREHSEEAAEGGDGLNLPEIRMHSQDAAEGPEDAG